MGEYNRYCVCWSVPVMMSDVCILHSCCYCMYDHTHMQQYICILYQDTRCGVCVCVLACVRACVCACVRACVRVCTVHTVHIV